MVSNESEGNFSAGKSETLKNFRRASWASIKRIFLVLPEHTDSIDDGHFIDRYWESLEWVNLPGSYHNGGASFSYADGRTDN